MIQESIERLSEIEIPDNPFPGLRPFELHESLLFFGRESQNERLIEKLGRTRFLAIVGTSGSGKSSLVRAGLLPALLGGMMPDTGSVWHIALMRPGNNPIGNLASALNSHDAFGFADEENRNLQIAITEATLRRGNLGLIEAVRQANQPANENLLVIADQFEELFRVEQGAQNEELANDKAAFVKLLLEAGRQREVNIYVVLTMRSDYLGECSQFQDLPEAINESQYLIPRLTRDQLRQTISGPVAVGGAKMTPRLVNRLLNDIGDQQDQLPILQHALMRTWDEWKVKFPDHAKIHQGVAIDVCCYEATGGMADALSTHANMAYIELLGARNATIAEKMFKCLTEKGEDNREVRRPVTLREICAVIGAADDNSKPAPEAEVIAVIEKFRAPGRSFLMPPAGTPLNADSLIDISHESLIRNWKRLSKWVEEEALSARRYTRLAETAVLYQTREAGLLRDADLRFALDWQQRQQPNKAWAQRYFSNYALAMDFLNESQADERQRLQDLALQEQEAKEKDRRALRRTRMFAGVLTAAFLVSLFATAFAYQQRSEALRLKNVAEQQKSLAVHQSWEAEKQQRIAKQAESDALEQKVIAEQKTDEAKISAERATAQAKIAEEQKQAADVAKQVAEKQRVIAVTNQLLAAQAAEKSRHLYYASSLNLAGSEFDNNNRSRGYELLESFLPQTTLGKTNDDRSFYWYYLWKHNFKEFSMLNDHTKVVYSVAFSSDGKTLATGSEDKTVNLWDVASRQEVATLKGHTGAVLSVAFSPDGRTLATGSRDSTVKLWDVASQKELATLKGHTEMVFSVAFSSDGRTLATGSKDETVKLWDVASRQEIAILKGHTGAVYSVTFSPDGRTLTTGSADETVRLWDVTSRQELAPLKGHIGIGHSVAYSGDGKMLAVSGYNSVELWDVASRQEVATLQGHGIMVTSLAFSSDGKTVAAGDMNNTVKLWDVASRQEVATLEGYTDGVLSVALSKDGKTLATGSVGNTVTLCDVASRQEMTTLARHTEAVLSVAFSPDGRTLATGSRDSTVKLWDVASRQELAPLKGHTGIGYSVAFSGDGKMLAVSSYNSVELWDVASRQEIATLKGHTEPVYSLVFSPDGRTLATGSADNTVKLWDVASRLVMATLKEHTEAVLSLAFSPDGRTLATSSEDETVKLWDVASRQELATLKGHTEMATSIAFSSDGKTLATSSTDKTVKLWDVASRQEVATLNEHTEAVFSIAFSSDGKTLATGSEDMTVRLYFAATDEEVESQRSVVSTKEKQ